MNLSKENVYWHYNKCIPLSNQIMLTQDTVSTDLLYSKCWKNSQDNSSCQATKSVASINCVYVRGQLLRSEAIYLHTLINELESNIIDTYVRSCHNNIVFVNIPSFCPVLNICDR